MGRQLGFTVVFAAVAALLAVVLLRLMGIEGAGVIGGGVGGGVAGALGGNFASKRPQQGQ
jgi:hypothetical protein